MPRAVCAYRQRVPGVVNSCGEESRSALKFDLDQDVVLVALGVPRSQLDDRSESPCERNSPIRSTVLVAAPL